jgi:hypothetical protein
MIQMNQKTIYIARKTSGIRINFWGAKILWRQERHYVAIPKMAVWERLACLAPDTPDRLSFADVVMGVDGSSAIMWFHRSSASIDLPLAGVPQTYSESGWPQFHPDT